MGEKKIPKVLLQVKKFSIKFSGISSTFSGSLTQFNSQSPPFLPSIYLSSHASAHLSIHPPVHPSVLLTIQIYYPSIL